MPTKHRATLATNEGLVPVEKRSWSPGFWERLLEMASEVDMDAPEPLRDNPDREAILDELTNY